MQCPVTLSTQIFLFFHNIPLMVIQRPSIGKQWTLFPDIFILLPWKGGKRMQIEIQIDEHCTEPKIIIVTNKMTDEMNGIIKKLAGEQTQMIAGFQDEQVTLLEPNQIYRIFASNGKVYAETELRKYVIRLRLYEMEQRLAGNSFVRISNSEIINLKKVRGFDLSFTGTICVSLSNGTVTYVSRRYVAKIKQLLGI